MKKIILLTIFVLSGPLFGSGKEGHGGDTYALNFRGIAETSLKYIAQALPKKEKKLKEVVTQMLEVIAEAPVKSWYRICLVEEKKGKNYFEFTNPLECREKGGTEKEAINIRAGKERGIIVGQKKWDKKANDLLEKAFLSWHEYLGLLKLEDDHPTISIQLKEFVAKNLKDFKNYFAGYFNVFQHRRFVCLIRWEEDDQQRIETFEWKKNKEVRWIKEEFELELEVEPDYIAKLDGRMSQNIWYYVNHVPNQNFYNRKKIVGRQIIEFKNKAKREVYVGEIETKITCYTTL